MAEFGLVLRQGPYHITQSPGLGYGVTFSSYVNYFHEILNSYLSIETEIKVFWKAKNQNIKIDEWLVQNTPKCLPIFFVQAINSPNNCFFPGN
jgi:hypothetical protein